MAILLETFIFFSTFSVFIFVPWPQLYTGYKLHTWAWLRTQLFISIQLILQRTTKQSLCSHIMVIPIHMKNWQCQTHKPMSDPQTNVRPTNQCQTHKPMSDPQTNVPLVHNKQKMTKTINIWQKMVLRAIMFKPCTVYFVGSMRKNHLNIDGTIWISM